MQSSLVLHSPFDPRTADAISQDNVYTLLAPPAQRGVEDRGEGSASNCRQRRLVCR